MITLEFKNKESAHCSFLGTTKFNEQDYIILFDNAHKEIYIYKYMKKKKDIYRLFPITDKGEFRAVCTHISKHIQ